MSDINPIDPPRRLGSVQRIRRDADRKREERPPPEDDENDKPADPEEPPHIDEYA